MIAGHDMTAEGERSVSDSTVEKSEPEVVPFMAYLWATVLTGVAPSR